MFKLPKLPYPYDSLEPYIDEETMRLHHLKHHQAYVDNLNKALAKLNSKFLSQSIEDLIINLKKIPLSVRTGVRNFGGGHINHTFFWKIMTPEKLSPSQKLLFEINRNFRNLENLKQKFFDSCLSLFGSGWVWIVYSNKNLRIRKTANQDSPLTRKEFPILGIDLWEHAYYLKYQNKRADYINSWWNVINWKQVEANLDKARKFKF